MLKLRNIAFWGQWVPLPLRLIIGFGFMAHGWAKFSPCAKRRCRSAPKGTSRPPDPIRRVSSWVIERRRNFIRRGAQRRGRVC